jgi:prepilin-type N-terminal cleavage/methylation domain-containing protein
MSAGIDPIRAPGRGVPSRQQGFSILEVLLALAASTVLATGIGSLMVSGVRSQARVETYNRLQSSWYQAANVLEAEAALAERIQSATAASTGCANLAPADVKLVLVGPANAWRTYYGVRSLSTTEATTWYGPNLLVRCGQPFRADAKTPTIDTSGAVSEGVVADGLPNATSFTVTLASANSASGEISRAATVNLTLGAPGGGGSFGNNFALRLTYNAVYGLNNDIINNLISCGTDPCQAPVLTLPSGKQVIQWRVSGTSNATITGTAGAENVVYINTNQSDFFPLPTGSTCDSSSCILTKGAVAITMTNVNTLVFNDTTVGL